MTKSNTWAKPLIVVGIVLLAAAAVLSWIVVPNRKELPQNTDTTRQLSGTGRALLNPQAIAAGDMNNALLTSVPVTAERNVKVVAVEGGNAQVVDTRSLAAANGQQLGQSQVSYAVDRKSLEAASSPPAGWQVTPHEGLTVSWPIGSEQKDYTTWINETQTTTPAKYVREEQKGDVSTYVYEVNAPAAPIKDPQVLEALPKGLPTAQLGPLVNSLPLPDEVKAQLAQALPSLGEQIQPNYTYEVKATYWVEPTTGLVVDTQRDEVRKATVGPIGVPVYDVTTKFTEQSVTDASNEAADKKGDLSTWGKTVPMILLIAGIIALLIGLIGWLTGRRNKPDQPDQIVAPRAG